MSPIYDISKDKQSINVIHVPYIPDYSLFSPCKKCMVRIMCKRACSLLKSYNVRKDKLEGILYVTSRVILGIILLLIIFIVSGMVRSV